MASGTSRHFPLTPTVPGHLFPRAMQGRSCGTGAGPILRPASPLAGPPQAPRQAPRFVSFWNPGKVTSALHPFSLLKQEEALIILAGRAGKGKASQANERRTAGEVREQGRWPKRFIRYSPIPRRRPGEIYGPKVSPLLGDKQCPLIGTGSGLPIWRTAAHRAKSLCDRKLSLAA